MRKKRFSAIAMLLCAVLLAGGPTWPLRAYAAVDEETGEEEYVNGEDDYGADATNTDNIEEETGNAASSASAAVNALQAQMDTVAQEKKALEAAAKALADKVSGAKSEKEKAQAVQNNIYENISITEGQISLLAQNISLLEQDIAEKQDDIKKKQGEIDANYALFKARLRAKYMQDNGTVLGLLLGADSFVDFLTRSEYMVRIGQHDQDLMALLTVERKEIEKDQAALEDRIVEIESNKAETESKKQDLSKQYNVAALQVQDIDRQEREYLADLAKNKALQDAATAELNRIIQEIQWSQSEYVGGEMAWPLPGHRTITSRYGYRFGGSDFHYGIDISSNGSGCYGAAIVAANDGTVAKVNTAYTQGVGYGIYVMLDHGGQMATLYGHCSSILVSEGQEVKRGETIALVGSTGWSTGPHLHFEVRKNGQYVEPGQYIGV